MLLTNLLNNSSISYTRPETCYAISGSSGQNCNFFKSSFSSRIKGVPIDIFNGYQLTLLPWIDSDFKFLGELFSKLQNDSKAPNISNKHLSSWSLFQTVNGLPQFANMIWVFFADRGRDRHNNQPGSDTMKVN